MSDTVTKLDLDNTLLAYLFDPDDGLAGDITAALNTMAGACENLEAEIAQASTLGWDVEQAAQKLEVAEAQLEFYTDVWQKIQAGSPSETVVAEIVTDHAKEAKTASQIAGDLERDIGLCDFLVLCGQVPVGRRAAVDWLVSRGWHQ